MSMTGRHIGQYRLDAVVGEGGMGTVYRAVDEMLDREVAVKLLRPELVHRTDFVERFKTEAITLGRLDHPRIARLFGFFRQDDHLLMVMEFVRGRTLASIVHEGGAVSVAAATAWTSEILEGLRYAHGMGVVHRDIKPANIQIDETGHVRLMDFGIARVMGDTRMTQTGQTIGTVSYMAPEQVMAQDVDGRTDLYATGVVLFEMLTGRTPYRSTTTFTLMQEVVQGVSPTLIEALPEEAAALKPVLRQALAALPDERFADAEAMRRSLIVGAFDGGAVLDPESTRSHTSATTRPQEPPVTAPALPWQAALATLTAVLGVALLVAAAVLAWQLRSPTASPDQPVVTHSAERTADPQPDTLTSDTAADPSPEVELPAPTTAGASPPPRATQSAGASNPGRPAPDTPVARPGATTMAEPSTDRDAGTIASPAVRPDVSERATATRPPSEFRYALLMVEREDYADEIDATVRFENGRLVVVDAGTRVPLRTIGYSAIGRATYSFSRRRFRLIPGGSHWLTLDVGRTPVVLRLDKRNFESVVEELEARSGRAVHRVETQ